MKYIIMLLLGIQIFAQDLKINYDANEWKHQVMIYGWLAYPKASVTFEIPPSDGGGEAESSVADSIDLFFMTTYRAQKKKFNFTFDGIYLGMSNDSENMLVAKRTVKTKSSLDAWLGSMYAGYIIYNKQWISINLISGLRYVNLELAYKINTSGDILNNHKFSKRFDLLDAVIGVDGSVRLWNKWFLPYHFDIGTGSSSLTYRASSGVGYGLNWGDILFSYRHLYYDLKESKVLNTIEFSGPLIGVNIRF